MKPPEPCLKDRCWSPMACNDWGYCRNRNEGRCPTAQEQQEFRELAKERDAKSQ